VLGEKIVTCFLNKKDDFFLNQPFSFAAIALSIAFVTRELNILVFIPVKMVNLDRKQYYALHDITGAY